MSTPCAHVAAIRSGAVVSIFTGAALVLLAGVAHAQSVQGVGPEFAVNTYTTSAQSAPAVACTSDGRCAVAWVSLGQDGDGSGVFVRSYDSSGVAAGSEQLVNTTTAGSQAEPSVCMDAGGAMVVTWSGAGNGDTSGVFARRYDSSGSPLGSELLVNSSVAGDQLHDDVACFADGSFVATWTGVGAGAGQDGSGSGVYGQRFDALGAPNGTEFQVNAATAGNQSDGGVSVAPSGEFVVAWDDQVADPLTAGSTGEMIRGRRYDAAGAPLGGDFVVATAASGFPIQDAWLMRSDVAHGDDGGYLVAFTGGYFGCEPPVCASIPGRVVVRRYDSAGVAGSFSFVGSSLSHIENGSVAGGLGGYVLAWDLTGGPDVLVRPFDIAGDVESDAATINEDVTGGRRAAAVAGTGGDRYFAVWAADVQDGGGMGIVGRYLCHNQDGDGVCDADDLCPADPDDDLDNDGLCGDVDNCPAVANAGQQDGDGDGAGDVCDACPGFDDFADADGDGIADGCDVCPADPENDVDGDGLCADADNCPELANAGQADGDGDGVGDDCDACLAGDDSLDSDFDGIPDACDPCYGVGSGGDLETGSSLALSKINADPIAGNDRLKIKGTFPAMSPSGGIHPEVHGGRVVVSSTANVVLFDISLPPGVYGGSGTAGWVHASGSDVWTYRDSRASPSSGIRKLRLKSVDPSTPTFSITVNGSNGTYPVTAADVPLRLGIVIGDPAAGDGTCTAARFATGQCGFNGSATALKCR